MASRLVISLFAVWLIVSLCTVAVSPAASAQENGASTYERIDNHVQELMGESNIPGVALTVVQDGQTVHSQGYGETSDDGRAVTPQTPFIIGSTTKSITALAVMQLVDSGLVDLDEPVQTYIPWFRLADAGASARMTVRHLLIMASGIPADAGGEAFRSTVNMTPEAAVRALRNARIAFEPGSAFEYVNANYAVLGLLIQTVTGQTYGDYVRQHIFEPLDMHHSHTDPALARQDGFADGHRYWFGRPVAYKMPYLEAMVPAGYVISTSEDLSRYLQMYLNNGTYNGKMIISAEGIAELTAPGFEFELGPWADGATTYYAMGWLVGGPWGDQPTIFHPGGAPSFTATLHVKPDQQLGVVTLTNSAHFVPLPGAQEELRQIPRGVMNLLMGDEPLESAGLNRFYLFFNLTVLVLVAVQVAALVRLIRRTDIFPPRPLSATRLWTTSRITVPLLWELGLGALVLLAPTLITSWRHVWVWTPDLAVVALLVGTLWLVTGVTRAVRIALALTRSRRSQEEGKAIDADLLPAH